MAQGPLFFVANLSMVLHLTHGQEHIDKARSCLLRIGQDARTLTRPNQSPS